jgi:hypothetical protein
MKRSAYLRVTRSALVGAPISVLVCIVVGAAVSACGGSAPPAVPTAESKLIHSPPVAKLSDQQLRALSMDCEKYMPDQGARGPYDAAYCEAAMAAWADAPIQMLPFEKDASAPQSSAAPR